MDRAHTYVLELVIDKLDIDLLWLHTRIRAGPRGR